MDSVGSLRDIPDDFGINYFKFSLSLRKKQRAQAFVTGAHIEDVKIFVSREKFFDIKAEVWPSTKKNEGRHIVNMEIDITNKCIVDAFCKCKQG